MSKHERISSRLLVSAAGVSLVALATWALPPSSIVRGQHPAGVQANGEHQDLFRSTKPETAHVDWDPRLKPEIKYSPIGDKAIIQGDIVIGKLADVRMRKLYSWSDEARQINVDDASLDLTKEQKDIISALKSIPLPHDVAVASRRRQRSKALRIINDLVRFQEVGKSLADYPTPSVDAYQEKRRTGGAEQAAEIQIGARYRWPGGVIPYQVDGDLPNQTLIAQAIDHWHTNTDRIHLRPATTGDADYVRFVLGDGCSSSIGRVGGEQQITLTVGCGVPQIIHEIGHAVGLWHEQCRNNRDNYLIIHDENVDPEQLHNFDPAGTEGQDVGRFDFGSIMLYPKWAFSDNGQPTMVPRFPNVGDFGVGSPNITSLSSGDLDGIRVMYILPANPPNPKHPAPPTGAGGVATAASAAPIRPVPIPNLRDRAPRVLPPISAPRR